MATLSGEENIKNGSEEDCLSKAAEAASRVNALLIAKGKLKPCQLSGDNRRKPGNVSTKFDAEVEINDAPIICRDILTKNVSQDEISKKTGAFITTKGRYISPEQRHLTDITQDRPLYLYIQAETEANVQRAVSEINSIIHSHGGVVNQTRGSTISIEAPAVPQQQPNLSQPPPGYIPASSSIALPPQVQFLTEKLFIGLEHAPPSFDVRGKVLGSEGSFLQHIHSVSGAVVTLRGRNSGYLEPETTQESSEPMHIHLQHISVDGLEHAKNLANDLIKTVQNDYSQFQRQLALHSPMVSSVVSHTVPGTFVTMQNVHPGVLNYQPQEQVILTSAASLAQPVSIVVSQHPPYNHNKPPMYVQSGPHPVPMTPALVTHTPVGYNSLTSQGIEVVHQAIPISRPLTTLQSATSEVVATGTQPLMTILPHPSSIDTSSTPSLITTDGPAVTLQPQNTIGHTAPSVTALRQPIDMSQHQAAAAAVPASIQPVNLQLTQSADSTQLPISVVPLRSTIAPPTISAAPTIITSNHDGAREQQQVILVSHSVTSVTDSLNLCSSNTMYPIPVSSYQQAVSSHQQAVSSVVPKPPSADTVTYIVQRPVEPHLVHIEQSLPDGSLPPPAQSTSGHVTAVINDVSASQAYTLNEYGHSVVPAPVEMVHVQSSDVISHPPPALPHHIEAQPVHINAQLEPCAGADHRMIRPATAVAAIPVSHTVSVARYPPPTHVPPPAPPSVSSTQMMIPSLMDLDLQASSSHVPPPPPPPIEPPPHLADSYQSGKRQYGRDKPYYQMRSEIRPPYRGSGRPYSAITPPPINRSCYDGGHKYKRQFGPRYSPPTPPP